MKPIIQESYPALRPEQLDEVERGLEVVFPEEYRAFLAEHNGGHPQPEAFRMPSGDVEMVDRFLGIRPGEHNDLTRYVGVYQARVPRELVPVAHDSFGNLICIGVRGAYTGKVFFWDHDREVEEGEEPDYENVALIAGDFEEFLEMFEAL